MTVYVDNARNPFGRMLMSHLWADNRHQLLAMADKIGVAHRWLQKPPHASWEHFDICQTKRALAIAAGAIETDKYDVITGALEHVARLEGNQWKLDQIARCRAVRQSDERAAALLEWTNEVGGNIADLVRGALTDRASDIAEIAALKAELEHWKQLYDSAGGDR